MTVKSVIIATQQASLPIAPASRPSTSARLPGHTGVTTAASPRGYVSWSTGEGRRRPKCIETAGQAQAIGTVFQAVHDNDPDPKLLAYQYLQTLPQLAQSEGNTFWVIPSEVTTALRSITKAFGEDEQQAPASHVKKLGPLPDNR